MLAIANLRLTNATPHPVRFEVDGELVEVPSEPEAVKALTATAETEIVRTEGNVELVKTTFKPSAAGLAYLDEFKKIHHPFDGTYLIIGSIISAQAYGYPVVGLVPVAGYERVPPAEKRFRVDRFNVFE